MSEGQQTYRPRRGSAMNNDWEWSRPTLDDATDRIMRRVERQCILAFAAGWLACLVLVLAMGAL